MAEPLTTPSGIMIVYLEEGTEEGGKGIFGSVRRRVEKMAALNVEGLRTNLQDFCLQMGSMMSHLSSAVSEYNLHSFEVSVEVTAN